MWIFLFNIEVGHFFNIIFLLLIYLRQLKVLFYLNCYNQLYLKRLKLLDGCFCFPIFLARVGFFNVKCKHASFHITILFLRVPICFKMRPNELIFRFERKPHVYWLEKSVYLNFNDFLKNSRLKCSLNKNKIANLMRWLDIFTLHPFFIIIFVNL